MELPGVSRRVGALFWILLLAASPLVEAAVGRTQGYASVSDGGEAQYSIPIALPPGTNGMTPVLSLDYRHRSRGGLLGVGWSIGGLSQITRCPRTFAQDGVASPPLYSILDRFCLDGQRLALVHGSVYHSANAEYRTEIESFARIRAVAGSSTNGPAHFTVEAADGRIYEYGATHDSRIDRAAGAATHGAMTWALNRIRDRSGNVIDFRYTEDVSLNSYRIAGIQYNANPTTGVAASHDIAFNYESRPSSEVDAGYFAGVPVLQVMRLVRIDVRHQGAVLRRYNLAYEPALSTGGRSRLASIQECGAGGSDCLAPTSFEWQDGAPGASAVSAFPIVAGPLSLPQGHAWNLADINGDGRDDYIWSDGAVISSSTIRYRLSLADGAFGPAVNTGIASPVGIGRPFDANGDGRADLLVASPANRWAFIPGTASGFGGIVDTGVAIEPGTRDYRGADLNGDGLGDIAWSEAADPHGNSLLVRVRYARPAGGYGAPVTLYSQWQAVGYPDSEGGEFIGRPGRRIDLNGDGAEDLLMNENFSIARITGAGHGTDRFDVPFFGAKAFDFNDDGCTDFAYKRSTAGLRVRVGHCSTNGTSTELQGPAWTGAAELHALDWNADGREDILVRGAANWMVALSLGNALGPIADTGIPHEGAKAIAGPDLDGDGLDDIALASASQVRVRFRAGPVPDLLVSAVDGFGVETVFEYRPLTDAAVHARGSAAEWPDQDLQTADSVVSKLRVTDGTGKGYRASAGYRYEGLRRNTQGRGSLGFRKLVRTELSVAEPLSTETTRRQDYPFAGLPESILVRQSSGKTVSSVAYLWSKLDHDSAPSSPRFPYPSKVTMRRFEVGGALDGIEITRTVREVAAIDPISGLVTDETTTTTEIGGGANTGSSASLRTLHASVLNDTAHWCLGRSQAVGLTASHTLPGGAPITRTAEQAWDGARCAPTQTRIMPDEPGRAVTYDYVYDAFGNIASETVTGAGMASRAVKTYWGLRGRYPEIVKNPLSQATLLDWDASMGVPVSLTDPNGQVIEWAYDGFGRLARETQPDGASTRWTRTLCKQACDTRTKYGLRQEELDAANVVRVTADLSVDQHERGFRLVEQQPGGGRSATQIDFGSHGELTRQHLPHWDGDFPPGFLTHGYDALGRLVETKLAATGGVAERTIAVRHEGLSVTQTDGLDRSTTGTRSAWGHLVEVVDAAGGHARYEYDAFGALLRARDALNNTVASIGHDARGFRVSVADMDMGAWSWTRNALGETTALRDAKGQVTSFEYDKLGRLTKRMAPDGTSTWTWGASATKNDTGRLVASAGPGYSESFEYDLRGRPAAHTINADASYRYQYSYNALGLLDTMTYPAAGAGAPFRIRHDYDAGRLSRISDAGAPGQGYWTLNAQDASGHALDETLGTSIRVVTGFSPVHGEMEYRQTMSGNGPTIQDVAYAWDAAGNLASRRDLEQSVVEEFRHDALDRLVEGRRNGALNLELDYDAIGNIRRKSDVCPGTTPCYTYHAKLKHAVTAVGTQNYVYDANGNMTKRGGAAIAWSSANLPVSIAHSNGNNSQFSYGPSGNRWKQVAKHGGASETTVYAGGLFEKATRGGLTTWRHYVPAPGGVALHLRFSDGSAPATRYLTLDHLGSTDDVVDAAGNVVVSESFAPFGSRRKPDWTGVPTAAELAKIAAQTRDGFAGHEHLDNLDLVHMSGRVYDPRIGRFISADPYVTLPFDGQGLNRYSYVLGNPLAFTDPSGFDAVPCAANQSGQCVQIVVIGVNWPSYLRASGGAHSSEIASALERDPCGQNGSALACSMQGVALVAPSSVVLTIGRQPDPTLSTGGRLDAVQGFAARIANLAISSSPIAMLFGADPDFQYFREPASDSGRLGSTGGNVGYFLGGAAGIARKGGSELLSSTRFARSLQGTLDYPGIDRFKDIVLKKGTVIFAGYPGQGHFYTTLSAIRRIEDSAFALNSRLQIAPHRSRPPRARYAAYEVLEDTPAAFGLAMANPRHGPGGLPQIVVPSFSTSLRYIDDYALVP